MKNIYPFYALLITLLLGSCEKDLIGQEPADNYTNNFDRLWQDFSDYYGQFDVKNIDWDSIYIAYRPQVSNGMAEGDFYNLIVALLTPLNDPHVTLYPTVQEFPRWSIDLNNGVKTIEDFDFDLVRTKYVTSMISSQGPVQYGIIGENTGYLHIDDFEMGMKNIEKIMHKALSELAHTKGLIVDIRDTPGGRDPESQLIASYFTRRKTLYMTSIKKNGPGRMDFSEPEYWYLEPRDITYDQPVCLMTTRYSMSGAETFTLAMRATGKVTQVGDTTGGAFSDVIMREMYNGWLYSISVGDYRDAGGASYEGKGIPPDVLVENTAKEISQGIDAALERAIQVLN